MAHAMTTVPTKAILQVLLTLAKRVAQIGSTSGTLAALMIEFNLSACITSQLACFVVNTIRIAYSDIKAIIGKDERSVGCGEFGGRHCD